MGIMVFPSNESLGQTRFLYVSVFIAFCLIITPLNCVTLAVLFKPLMRSVKSNHFLISLAVSDVTVGVLLCPMIPQSTWMPLYSNTILFSLLVLPHTTYLQLIAYDCFLMTNPNTHHNKMTSRKVKLIPLAAWGVPLLNASSLFVDIQVFASFIFVLGVL